VRFFKCFQGQGAGNLVIKRYEGQMVSISGNGDGLALPRRASGATLPDSRAGKLAGAAFAQN
jgi:hypothetical protein